MKGLLLLLALAALSASLEAVEQFRQVEEGVYVLGNEKDGELGVPSNMQEQGWRRITLQPDENGEVALYPGGPQMVTRSPHHGFAIGSLGLWDVMLAHYQPMRTAIPNTSVQQEIRFISGSSSVRINYIRVVQVSGVKAEFALILSGGIGETFVNILIRSASGQGFQFSIDIWGR